MVYYVNVRPSAFRSWIEETAIRRRAEMESPQGGDHGNQYTGGNATLCDVATSAERVNLSRARERIRNIM